MLTSNPILFPTSFSFLFLLTKRYRTLQIPLNKIIMISDAFFKDQKLNKFEIISIYIYTSAGMINFKSQNFKRTLNEKNDKRCHH